MDPKIYLNELNKTIFGTNQPINLPHFNQWVNAKLEFSVHEESALVQRSGGPCVVLAPLQAYIISVLKDEKTETKLQRRASLALQRTQSETVANASVSGIPNLTHLLETEPRKPSYESQDSADFIESDTDLQCDNVPDQELSTPKTDIQYKCNIKQRHLLKKALLKMFKNLAGVEGIMNQYNILNPLKTKKSLLLHDLNPGLMFSTLDDPDLKRENCYVDGKIAQPLLDNFLETFILPSELDTLIPKLMQPGGTLLLLYNIIHFKTINAVSSDLGIDQSPLIETQNGMGEQALLNLLLFGLATPQVFDGFQDLGGGMILQGVASQPEIGFLTIHEAFRYVTVGDFLKSPKYNIWVLASESHFTVFWTFDDINTEKFVQTERSKFRRVLKKYDVENAGFIKVEDLKSILAECDLENSDDYINCMKPVLDPDSLGIILYDAFLDNFCDGQEEVENTCFNCFHYNGRIESNINQKVVFNLGRAQVVDFQDNGMAVNEISQILATRWKGVQIDWDNLVVPSVI